MINLATSYEAAEKLGVHPKTVSRLLRLGKLAGIKIANRWFIDKTILETFSKTYVGRKGRPKGSSLKRRLL